MGILAMALVVATFAAAGVQWSDRGNRYEGVIGERDVSGGYLKLVGLSLGPGPKTPRAEVVRLGFRLPRAARLQVRVWEPESNYWMVPHTREYAAGEHYFEWPAGDVLRPLGLGVKRLLPLVAVEEGSLHVPARLGTGSAAAAGEGYRFWFDSRVGVEAKAAIRDGRNGAVVVRFEVIEDYPGLLRLDWDGRATGGEVVPAGELELYLEGVLLLSDSDRPFSTSLRFLHPGVAP